MIAANLAEIDFPPHEAASWAISIKARVSGGTDMRVLSKALASRLKLKLNMTSSMIELQSALESGAMAIVNVGGDRSGYKGVFSNGGHYVVVYGFYNGKVVIADPGYYAGKYSKSWRKAVTVLNSGVLLADLAVIDKDASNRSPKYYVFKKEVDR